MRILMWDVHGGYTDSLVAGTHDYLFLPPEPSGRGGLARYGDSAPSNTYEVSPEELRDRPPDLILLQRLEELELCVEQLGLRAGEDVPAIFCEHNTPKADVPFSRHPLADQAPGLSLVHVTHFNELFWDCGRTPTRVIEHGVADPGLRYTGRMPRLAFVVNEPVRRWRVTGTDLLSRFAEYEMRSGSTPTSCRLRWAWLSSGCGSLATSGRMHFTTRSRSAVFISTSTGGPHWGCPSFRRCCWECRSSCSTSPKPRALCLLRQVRVLATSMSSCWPLEPCSPIPTRHGIADWSRDAPRSSATACRASCTIGIWPSRRRQKRHDDC